jgi:hypothetical protein
MRENVVIYGRVVVNGVWAKRYKREKEYGGSDWKCGMGERLEGRG